MADTLVGKIADLYDTCSAFGSREFAVSNFSVDRNARNAELGDHGGVLVSGGRTRDRAGP